MGVNEGGQTCLALLRGEEGLKMSGAGPLSASHFLLLSEDTGSSHVRLMSTRHVLVLREKYTQDFDDSINNYLIVC